MRIGIIAFGVMLMGCFHPTYDHPACGPNGECPDGLACGADLTCGAGDDAARADGKLPKDGSTTDGSTVDGPCADTDHNGVCDDVQWPCGALPTPPPSTVSGSFLNAKEQITLSAISLANAGQLVVVSPSQVFAYTLTFSLIDTSCANNCTDQLEIGYSPGMRQGCPFDGAVARAGGEMETITGQTLTAPSAAGVYDVRYNIGQDFSCNGTNDWWVAAPGTANTIAEICVH